MDCAACAAKMQDAVGKIEGVKEVTVSFIAQKMTLEYDEAREKEIFKAVKKTCKKVEPDCTILGM